VTAAVLLDLTGLQQMVDTLAGDGFTVLGPVVRDGAIVPGPLATIDDLPRGVGDAQAPGRYRLTTREDEALFGYAADLVSWKAAMFPSRELLWRGVAAPEGFATDETTRPAPALGEPPYALLGVRSCDVHALAIHDQVLLSRQYQDEQYAARRSGSFVVTVVCSDPSDTCFCTSMGTGPSADAGFDLALTELLDGGHRFLVRAGTERGAALLERLPARPATPRDHASAERVVDDTVARIDRRLDTTDIRDLLYANAEHLQWDDVASRCLSCGNCTSVCPTCFCTSVEDHTSLSGDTVERSRVWDSCFSSDFSHLHGGDVRSSPRSRYRQWATHKLGSWIDQFGTSGCVGCGRCLTSCPVGIDLTAEMAAIRATPGRAGGGSPDADDQ
jgi:sulfhydrogenase subunit beta (sulfur reductase)